MSSNLQFTIQNSSSRRGATLIEVLIYITIFGFVMSAFLVSVNQILRYSHTASSKSSVEAEAAFIMAKIAWTLNDVDSVDVPSANDSGLTLTVTKSTGQTTINSTGDDILIDGEILNSSRVTVANLSFDHILQTGTASTDSVRASFSIDGKNFEIYRTIR